MKKYTIKDKTGRKKTFYAKDLAHALTFVDSKIEDDYLGMVKINGRTWYVIHKKSVGMPEFWGITPDKWGDNPKKKFYSKADLDKYLKSVGAISDSIEDDVVSNYFYFDLDDLSMSLDNAVNIMKSCGLTIIKINKHGDEAKVYYRGTSAAEQKAADKLDIFLDDSINNAKAKDEANLPTTLQALVNDEEAAIKAYEVAIKNLEGKIDETQMQVLINIMKDERRHVENLYAILNGQVTEKNLEDSIKDGVNEAKKLVEQAGFKVKRAYGTNDEPYITVVWDGSYAELQRKVRALKSEAKKIGYKEVYADDDDICFSKW